MNRRTEYAPVLDPQNLARELVKRQQDGDADGMAALYEPQAVLAIDDHQFFAGREAICAFYTRLIATGVKFQLADQRAATVCGDLALTSARLPNGDVTAEVARRQSDGSWLWVIDRPKIV